MSPKGTQDYYAGVDITFQTLTRVLNRPTYGGAQAAKVEQVLTASVENTLVNVSGEGLIYGGILHARGFGSITSDTWRLYIDGAIALPIGLTNFEQRYGLVDLGTFMRITMWDATNHNYTWTLQGPVTFDSSFKITYVEASGNTPTAEVIALYAVT